MSIAERLARWAIVIGFALLAAVTALAAVMIKITGRPGNVAVLSLVATAFYLRRVIRRAIARDARTQLPRARRIQARDFPTRRWNFY